jgi:hypothetical protein
MADLVLASIAADSVGERLMGALFARYKTADAGSRTTIVSNMRLPDLIIFTQGIFIFARGYGA